MALVSRAPANQAASTLDRGSNETIKILSPVATAKSHKAGYLPRSLAPRSGSCRRKSPSTPPSHDYPLGAIRQTSINDYLGARFTLPVEDDRTALAGHGLNQSGGRPPHRRDTTSSTGSTPSSHDGAGVEILFLTPDGSGTGLRVCGGGDIPGRMFLPPPPAVSPSEDQPSVSTGRPEQPWRESQPSFTPPARIRPKKLGGRVSQTGEPAVVSYWAASGHFSSRCPPWKVGDGSRSVAALRAEGLDPASSTMASFLTGGMAIRLI